MSMSQQWQLEYLLNHSIPKFDRIWYFGIGWNIGVRRDNIGWGHLCDSIKFQQVELIEIATKQNCVAVNSQPYATIPLTERKFSYPDFNNSDWKITDSGEIVKQNLEWNHLLLEQYVPID
jgi:hypothetical protein